MKILIVGASGTLGKAAAEELGARHDIIRASRSGLDIAIDIGDAASIQAAYKKLGTVDAVVSAVGNVHFGDLADMDEEKYRIGIDNKDSVLTTFGSPSTVSTVDASSWYYISSIHEQTAFFAEEAEQRLATKFGQRKGVWMGRADFRADMASTLAVPSRLDRSAFADERPGDERSEQGVRHARDEGRSRQRQPAGVLEHGRNPSSRASDFTSRSNGRGRSGVRDGGD